MKKQILNIGKALNKVEQRNINGGGGGTESGDYCESHLDCGPSSPAFGCCLSQNTCMTPEEYQEFC